MWELDYKEGWALKKWCFWTVVLEKTLESPLDCKEIQPANPKGNHSWIFIGRTDVEAETPILWPPDVKSWLTAKDPDAGKDWRQEEKGTAGGWDGWMASLTQWTWVWAKFRRIVKDREAWGAAVHGIAELDTTEWLKNIWTYQLCLFTSPPHLRGMTWVWLQAELYCPQLAPNQLSVVSQEIFVEQINEISPPTYMPALPFLISSYEWTMDCKLL